MLKISNLAALYGKFAINMDKETGHMSSVEQMTCNPNFQRIILLGEPAIWLLLKDLRQGALDPHWRMRAIDTIAENHDMDAPIIPKADAGDVEKMVKHYLAWGNEHQYI